MDTAGYPEALQTLLIPDRWNELGPGTSQVAARTLLQSLSPAQMFGPRPIQDPDMAECCLAGLWLLHDFLDESHRRSQELGSSSGSYWHAIMHRREPDYPNAKYWFRRVGRHPIFPELARVAAQLSARADMQCPAAQLLVKQTTWDPFRFVDLCEQAAGRAQTGSVDRELCQRVARAEWDLLFAYCYRAATDPSTETR